MSNAKQALKKRGIGPLIRSAIWLWARSNTRGLLFLLQAGWRLWRAKRRHCRQERLLGIHIPTVLVVSPTMRCNYNCVGCYSRMRSEEDELTAVELDAMLSEAEDLGFLAVLITGGEPFLRDDLLALTKRHQHLLFVIISNGSKISASTAKKIANSGNIIMLISVEGFEQDTDSRRGSGAHHAAIEAMDHLKQNGVLFGFSVTNHVFNGDSLSSERFIDEFIARGCAVGLYSEYVPCGPAPCPEWLLGAAERDAFHQRIITLGATKSIVLIQFPQDEYGESNRCTAAGQASLHINSQGGVEPCPFVPVAADNIRQGGLLGACQSAFLRSIREQEHLLKRDRYACSLFEHLTEVEALAKKYKEA